MSRENDPIELIRRALAGLRFGEITVSVHDGDIVQISRTEKIRTTTSRATRTAT